MNILALNAGSSSLKYRLFQISPDAEQVLAEGTAERVTKKTLLPAARKAITACQHFGIDAVGHRLVHGGAKFTEPTRVTPEVLDALHALSDLDPLHNPTEIALIKAAQQVLPKVPEVAVFDTAFHQTLPPVAYTYALPWKLSERLDLRRYGFHGISHRYVSKTLLKHLGRGPEGTKLITCHLGSGASVCALRDGKSVDTSMGMTPLAGLVMGTRSGDIDPGLLLYLLRSQKMTPKQVDDLLNTQSGLEGVSGQSSDVRDLDKAAHAGDTHASLALELFAYRVRTYIGAYAAVLGGLDAIAFAGGIGEHSASMRARICEGLDFLGLRLIPSLNDAATGSDVAAISAYSGVPIWVIPTDEERQIARETAALLGS